MDLAAMDIHSISYLESAKRMRTLLQVRVHLRIYVPLLVLPLILPRQCSCSCAQGANAQRALSAIFCSPSPPPLSCGLVCLCT
ncbi:MAG: hypothetical protein ACK56I_13440, partial [bacterium]